MRVALAQINTTVGDFRGNLARVREVLEKARERDLDLIVFPEQTLPGYPAEDLLEREDFQRAAADAFSEAIDLTRGHPSGVVLGTLEPSGEKIGKPVYNTAALIEDGELLGVQHKSLLPTYDVFDEARYFQPAMERRVLDFRGRKIGLAVCEDVWNDPSFWNRRLYTDDPVEDLVRKGADLLVVISASPFSLGRRSFRLRMLQNLLRSYGEVELVYTNLVGGNTTLVFDGNSCALGKRGQLLAAGASFREDFVEVDLARPEAGVEEAEDEVAEAFEALVLGTRDYLRKSGFQQAVLGLSGGVDSSLVAAVAARAIGPEKVIGIAMPSRYSSETSEADACILAERLGIDLQRVSIEPMFRAALETLQPVFRGREPDVTEENLQARIRGQILMAVSNKFGALLLTTGNKSELAVGYCTLYGDMCGGLAVISDVPKTLVYRICRYLNRREECIPARVLEKAPSAELRPGQLDRDSLPDYEVLDAIIEAYIEEGASPDTIARRGIDRELVLDIIAKIDRNEYKRKQAAPGLRITCKAFGPGRRFPIVQRYERAGPEGGMDRCQESAQEASPDRGRDRDRGREPGR